MVGTVSDRSRIGLGSVAHWKWRFTCFQQISVRCSVLILRGRRSIWWGWKLMPVAPRIVNDVSNVMCINHEIHFAWQAQYLVRLEGVDCCSAHWKWRFICDVHQSWDAFCVAGALFGEVGGWFLSPRALKMTFHLWCGSIMTFIMRGRRSIWWGWRVLPVAPRIVNDVSSVMWLNHHDTHFAWQGQYLVRLVVYACCFPQAQRARSAKRSQAQRANFVVVGSNACLRMSLRTCAQLSCLVTKCKPRMSLRTAWCFQVEPQTTSLFEEKIWRAGKVGLLELKDNP